MIRTEDRELEAMVLAGNSPIAVPIEIFIYEDGSSDITVYSCFESIAEEYQRLFDGKLLSVEAKKWLDEKLHATVKEFGYEHFDEDIHHLYEFSMCDISKLNNSDVKFEAKVINGTSELKGVDTALLDAYLINRSAAVVISDGKLVAVACENDITFDDRSVEIFVETDEAYRNKGYGYAAVCAFTEYYLKQGIHVRYKCAVSNDASVALANKCGFEKNGERYAYVCYAFDEE